LVLAKVGHRSLSESAGVSSPEFGPVLFAVVDLDLRRNRIRRGFL
jgi:hypothetical protein